MRDRERGKRERESERARERERKRKIYREAKRQREGAWTRVSSCQPSLLQVARERESERERERERKVMRSGSEEGSYLRLVDVCVTQH